MAKIKPFQGTTPSDSTDDKPKYKIPNEHTLTASDHSNIIEDSVPNPEYNNANVLKNKNAIKKHNGGNFVIDEPPPSTYEQTNKENGLAWTEDAPAFYGSRTSMNPTNDPEKQKILDTSLETYDVNRSNEIGGMDPPISADAPFIRSHPNAARNAIFTTYNRSKLPIADIEFRKGIRHIFFNRPECYLMSGPNELCEQAATDEDITSTFQRLPHIIKLLSPMYVTGAMTNDGFNNSNFNFLLSNRVQGLSTTSTTIGSLENTPKGYSGYTIMPASFFDSLGPNTIDLSFADTKYLEVYEYLRIWMMYMSKRHKGIFAPSYNNYSYRNSYININGGNPLSIYSDTSIINGTNPFPGYLKNHPYDRALEYCSSIFDIITNESGTRIIYWCKYYGVYPVSASPSLQNESNQAITSATTSASFRYMYKLECSNKSLLEFNYNAGIVNELGKVIEEVRPSMPYLLRNEGYKTSDSLQTLRSKNKPSADIDTYYTTSSKPESQIIPVYNGAAGMFTGSPYIVMGEAEQDPTNPQNTIVAPYLRFATLQSTGSGHTLNCMMNNGYVNDNSNEELTLYSLNRLDEYQPTSSAIVNRTRELKENVGL